MTEGVHEITTGAVIGEDGLTEKQRANVARLEAIADDLGGVTEDELDEAYDQIG